MERDQNLAGAIAESVSIDRDALLELIDTEDVRDELKSITGRAVDCGVFGALIRC